MELTLLGVDLGVFFPGLYSPSFSEPDAFLFFAPLPFPRSEIMS